MKKELELALVQDFPDLFREYKRPQTAMMFGCEHGDGWEPILRRMCERLEVTKQHVTLLQVKEKWGTLRVYWQGGDEKVAEIVHAAEDESMSVCELCGNVGRVRDTGWIVTRCDDCMLPKRAPEQACAD